MDINLLLDKAKEACVVKYDKDLAQKLKIRATSISNYRKGISLPDATVCAELADITGLPLTKVLGIVGEARAISREEKAVWRKLATLAATTLMIGTSITCPNRSQAQSISESSVMKVHIMHIMSIRWALIKRDV
ncbi:helix-turn-helix domain-containing protein [Xylella fastidiosa subsp. fastidiosa]|uniref:DUF3693 domain-containing protein n=1 Tax=Xylella fastidiosa TaxID=2371 RepID=UPI0013B482AD|nr:DUF3693 domain-containing protein [Xylella fastidiosa]QGJ37767.2 helix-turn-helix domain-containing protein [Xylella fastidiosa subsp. fastidiosa]